MVEKRGNMQVILGIDPGSRVTGFGVLGIQKRELFHLDHGVIEPPKNLSFAERLFRIGQSLQKLMEQYSPTDVVVEKIFLGRNADSAFKLGHVRGVCLLAVGEIEARLFEYAARSVKKAVTGHGGATKEHVSLVVQNLLNIDAPKALDASDALSLAICHFREIEKNGLTNRWGGDIRP